MAKLNRIATDLIYKSNKPENLKGIIDKGYAYGYAYYLAAKNYDIPDIIINAIVEDTKNKIFNPIHTKTFGLDIWNNPRQDSFASIVLLMKNLNIPLPKSFIDIICYNGHICAGYVIKLFSLKKFDKIEPEIFEILINGKWKNCYFILEIEKSKMDISVLPSDYLIKAASAIAESKATSSESIKNAAFCCFVILYALVRDKAVIRSFSQIDPKVLDCIFKDSGTKTHFEKHILGYLKDVPKDKIKESFVFWFKKRN